MYITAVRLYCFRSYTELRFEPAKGLNVIVGANAAGKTNILESVFLAALGRSHRTRRDAELINSLSDKAYAGIELVSATGKHSIELKLFSGAPKQVFIDGQRIRRMGELMGVLNAVMFSPEDLSLVKDSPETRRRFMDMELCQLDKVYLHFLTHYNKCLTQRNALLKEIDLSKDAQAMLDVWDAQLIQHGKKIVQLREAFVGEIAPVIAQIYHSLTGGREQLAVSYEPNVSADRFDEILFLNREREIRQKTTLTGPHRDDIRFRVQNMATGQTTDIRTFGSQGQQRSAALALKLAEIEIVKRKVNDTPVLLLDDVLSELDSSRQNYLLDSIHDIQTFITCTGLEEFVRHRFHMDQIYHVERGVVTRVNSLNSETIF